MEQLIKAELFKNIDSFINEIELTMEYLEPKVFHSIKSCVDNMRKKDDALKAFVDNTSNHLKTYEAQISAVLFSDKKIKSEYYNFLNSVSLFDNTLNFSAFEKESKNTKKGMIKYLYAIYMSCVFLNQSLSSDSTSHENSDVLQNRLTEFVNKIQAEALSALSEQDVKPSSSKRKHQRRNAISVPRNAPELGDFGNIMDSILGNTDILNIANDISSKMQSQNLNPMSMLSSLMSGNIENTPLQGLVEEIQQKVESKINSGEIDKEKLEEQAKNIMGTIGNNPSALNSMPGMTDLISNMVKDMENQQKN